MPQLEFNFSDFERELGAISRIAGDYIRYDSGYVIRQLIDSLERIRGSDGNRPYPWNIPEKSPLRTKTSEGQYEPESEGGRRVYGELSSTWEIRAVREKGHMHGPAKTFALVGAASTRIRIVEELEGGELQELAMWRMEIGSAGAPGACFHVQVLGEDDILPFPKGFPVPRLPTVMFAPMLAFDFLLGELFQDAWTEHVTGASDSGDVEIWRGIQKRRLQNLLKWQLKELGEVGATPWTWMKILEPPSDLFTREP